MPLKRDPQFTNADKTCLWEVLPLLHHFHPSVVEFAGLLLQGQPISYSGDPVQNFSLINFLDRFSFRSPKKKFQEKKKAEGEGEDEESDEEEEEEEYKPLTAADIHKSGNVRSSAVLPPVNSARSIQRDDASIPVEEVLDNFFPPLLLFFSYQVLA